MSGPAAKVYARLCESSLMEASIAARYTFLAFLAIADAKGRVIGTDERISTRIAVPLEQFREAIGELGKIDPASSSKLHEGRRLIAIEEPRGYKVVNYAAYQGRKTGDPKLMPTTAEAKAIGAIFKRREDTEWQPKEIEQYKNLIRQKAIVPEDLELLARYYDFERRKLDHRGAETGIHRRNLITFLNNYLGEVDKAREWARRNPRTAAKPLPEAKAPQSAEPEPEGFRAWLAGVYPQADQSMPWPKIPPDVRRQFKQENL